MIGVVGVRCPWKRSGSASDRRAPGRTRRHDGQADLLRARLPRRDPEGRDPRLPARSTQRSSSSPVGPAAVVIHRRLDQVATGNPRPGTTPTTRSWRPPAPTGGTSGKTRESVSRYGSRRTRWRVRALRDHRGVGRALMISRGSPTFLHSAVEAANEAWETSSVDVIVLLDDDDAGGARAARRSARISISTHMHQSTSSTSPSPRTRSSSGSDMPGEKERPASQGMGDVAVELET